ncbi:hypothetical protein D3C72_2133090 [compost metagenome]
MRHRLVGGQRVLVNPQVGEPEGLQHAGNDHRAVDTRKPQQMADQHRQQDRRQRIRSGDQRLEQRHDRLRQQQVELVLHQQAQRIQGDHHRQDRDQQIKRLFDLGRHLFRQ